LVGGVQQDGSYLDVIEVIDLAEDKLDCSPVPNYPFEIANPTMAYYEDKLIVCGGFLESGYIDNCFELTSIDSDWNGIDPLPDNSKDCIRSSIIDGKWVLTGGNIEGPDGERDFDNGVLIYDGEFTIGEPMPTPKGCHCQVTVNSTHLFITGGFVTPNPETFFLNIETGEYTILEENSIAFGVSACGLVDNPNGVQEIILTESGRSFAFSLDDLSWRDAPEKPINGNFMTSLQLSDGFLAISGLSLLGGRLEEIYKFDSKSYSWIELGEKVQIPRIFSSAAFVPNSFLNCQ